MPTFPNQDPDVTSTRRTNRRTRKAVFGDGYTQRSGDGINTQSDDWAVRFRGSVADIDTIEAFLNARAGVESFDWTPPRESTAKKWICEEWTRSYIGPDYDQLVATFSQVHEP